jgi:hypothetical protein
MGFNINNPIGSIIDLVKDGLDKWGPADKTVVAQLKSQLDQLRESDEAKAAGDDVQLQLAALANVQAEAKGESWLQRNWRPITALFLVGLVGAYWFGFTAPNLSQITVDDLFGLVKICLGGYYVGRSAEKLAPHVVEAVKAFKN